jgi:glycosyltransferase involved in cell wall biosynthesis
MVTDNMVISVVVGVTRSGTLKYLVHSILQQVYQNWELIILVQGKDADLLAEVGEMLALDDRIRSIHINAYGKTKALNLGIKAARGEVVALTDDDCEADPNWLSTIAQCFQAVPEVGIVAGNVVAPKASFLQVSTCPAVTVQEFIYRPSEHNYQAPPFFYFIGANYAIRKSILQKTGFFDEVFGPGGVYPGGEETDFCVRAEALDIAMWTTPRSIVHHTFGRRSGIRQVLKHQRAYARGKGALIGKLSLMNHRLAKEWSKEPTLKERFNQLAKRPRWVLLEMYLANDVAAGKETYLNQYILGPDCVSMLKHPLQEKMDRL